MVCIYSIIPIENKCWVYLIVEVEYPAYNEFEKEKFSYFISVNDFVSCKSLFKELVVCLFAIREGFTTC